MTKSNLPAEVHDHFRKANKLHGYVQQHLGEAAKHALETGEELLAAKATVPHGSWEPECERLFEGSASSARFYMAFAKNMAALPKRQRSAILLLESTLEGAAKVAKKAAKPPAQNTSRQGGAPAVVTPEPEPASDPFDEAADPEPADFGTCPNCAGTKWDTDDDGNVDCAKCSHPWGEAAGDADDDRVKTQRQKTVKTAEALMRAFDDLQVMKARAEHDEAIQGCKRLLALAKGWK